MKDRLLGSTAAEGPPPAFERRRPARKPFPAHLPRERVVIEAPTACGCCGSERIVKIGENVTDARGDPDGPAAPFHPTPRGWAGPSLLAMILFEKFGQHHPLNRQAERYAREGVDLSLSTLADELWPKLGDAS
jgi:transposase